MVSKYSSLAYFTKKFAHKKVVQKYSHSMFAMTMHKIFVDITITAC